jgi:hypothetical protein
MRRRRHIHRLKLRRSKQFRYGVPRLRTHYKTRKFGKKFIVTLTLPPLEQFKFVGIEDMPALIFRKKPTRVKILKKKKEFFMEHPELWYHDTD